MSSNESFICENEQFPGTFTKCCNWYTIKRIDDIDILVSNEEYRRYIDISTYRRKFASNWIFLLNWWKGKPTGSLECTFYVYFSYVSLYLYFL